MLLQDLLTNLLEAFRANSNKLPTDATLVIGDLEIGAVELKNAATDDRAKVAATTAIAAGDVALAVHDPSLPTLGQKTSAGSVSVVPASDDISVHQPNATAPVLIAITDGNSTQSAALTAGSYVITSDIDVAFTIAANPTSTTSKNKLWAKTYRWTQIVTANDKVAAIRLVAGDTGTVSLERQGA